MTSGIHEPPPKTCGPGGRACPTRCPKRTPAGGLPEKLRRELRQIVAPVSPHMALFRCRERVFDAVFLNGIGQGPRTRQRAVGTAACDVEPLQLFVRGG